MVLLRIPVDKALDVRLERLITDNDLVFLRVLLDARHKLHRIDHVDGKYAEKITDNERKRQMRLQPAQRIQCVWVDDIKIKTARNAPMKCPLSSRQ